MNKKTESGAVNESDFEAAFEQISAIKHISNSKEMKETVEALKVGLTAKQWEKRVENLRKLRGVVKGLESSVSVLAVLRSVESELSLCIVDLRSQIVREACICVSYFSVKVGVLFEAAVEPLVASLLTLVANGAKIMSSSGKTALKVIYKHTETKRLLPPLCLTLTSSRSTIVRQFCSELLCQVCEQWQPKKIESAVTMVSETLKKALSDADVEVRSSARKAFLSFYSRFNSHANKILLSLDTAKRSQIEKELPLLLDESVKQTSVTKTASKVINKKKKKMSDKSLDSQSGEKSSEKTSSGSSVDGDTPLSESSVTQKGGKTKLLSSLSDIVSRLDSRSGKERRAALEQTKLYLLSNQLNVEEVKCVADSLNLFFMENDSEVRRVFFSTLTTLIGQHLEQLGWWVDSLLVKLLHLKISPHRSDCSSQVDTVISIMVFRDPAVFLEHCCRLIVSETDCAVVQLSLAICQLTLGVLELSSRDTVTSLGCSQLLPPAVSVLLSWSSGSRSPQLKRAAHCLLLRLAHCDIVSALPSVTQPSRLCVPTGPGSSPSRIPTPTRGSLSVASSSLSSVPSVLFILSPPALSYYGNSSTTQQQLQLDKQQQEEKQQIDKQKEEEKEEQQIEIRKQQIEIQQQQKQLQEQLDKQKQEEKQQLIDKQQLGKQQIEKQQQQQQIDKQKEEEQQQIEIQKQVEQQQREQLQDQLDKQKQVETQQQGIEEQEQQSLLGSIVTHNANIVACNQDTLNSECRQPLAPLSTNSQLHSSADSTEKTPPGAVFSNLSQNNNNVQSLKENMLHSESEGASCSRDTEEVRVRKCNLAQLVLNLASEEDSKLLCVLLRNIAEEVPISSLDTVEEQLTSLCSSISKLVSHSNCSVRKQCIICSVALYLAVGERLWSSIIFDRSKKVLFDIYLNRATSN